MSDDRPFERLLRGAARRGRRTGPCLDAGLLAAYADGALSRSERAAVERHAADCPLCTEHLGLLASLPDPAADVSWVSPTPLSALWRGWRWLVPAATVAVVFAVWQRTETPRKEQAAQSFETRAEKAEAPLPNAAREGGSAGAAVRRQSPEPAPRDPTSPAPGARQMAKRAESGAGREGDNAVSKPTAETKAGPGGDAAASAAAPAAPSPQPPAAGSVPAPMADDAQEMRKDRASEAGREDVGPSMRSGREGRQTLAFGAQDVVRAAPGVLVRLSLEGIERSTDGGAHWTPEVAEAPAPLRTLACASAEVCWAGGDQGLLLLRDASGAWTRMLLPATSAIVGIEATSPREAVVTLSDGRRFRTTDGGAGWNEVTPR